MFQGLRKSIKNESSRDTTLIQTNIFESFKNLTALSKKQQNMKLQKEKQFSSPVVIEISDESDSDNKDRTKSAIGTSVEGELPFYFTDDSDDSNDENGCPPKPKSSLKRNVGEMMVLNKPIACSTPLRPSPTSLVDEGTMNDVSDSTLIMDTSSEEALGNTIPNINLNGAGADTSIESDSDCTIILDNSLEKIICIKQDILINPKTTENCTNPFTNSIFPNNFSASTSRKDIERVGSRNQSILEITKSFKSTSTTNNNSHNIPLVEENPRQITQMCHSTLNPGKSEPFLSHMSPQKNLNSRNRVTLKCGSNESQTASINTNSQKNTSSKPCMTNCSSPQEKSDTQNQKNKSKSGCSGHTSRVANGTAPQMCTCKVTVTTSSNGNLGFDKTTDSAPCISNAKQNQSTSVTCFSVNCETGAQNLSMKKIDSNKPEGAADELSKSDKKSDTKSQKTSKPSSSGTNSTTSQKINTSKNVQQTSSEGIYTKSAASSSDSGNSGTETEINSSQNGTSNNNNILSSSSVVQTPTKLNLSNPRGFTQSKEKCGTPTSIDEEQNGIDPSVSNHKEVKSTALSVTPRTPTKHKLSDSPTASPSKRANKTPSPKKEERKMNINNLKVFKELFLSVRESHYLRNLIEEETPVLKLIISSDPKYFYFILKLFTWLPKRYNIFRFCEKIFLEMEDKEVLEMYTFLQANGIVDVDFSNEDISDLLNDLDRIAVKRIYEKFKLKRQLKGKTEMINALLKYSKTQSTLTFKKSTRELILDAVLLEMGKCVKLKNRIQDAFYKIFLLGTFTNPTFVNIQEFFRSIMVTKTLFPEYRIEDYCVFYTREEFARYATARRFKDGLYEAMKNHNHIEIFQISENVYTALEEIGNENTGDRFETVPHLERFTACSVYISILTKACDFLKTKYPRNAKVWLEYLIRTFPSSHRLANWYHQLTWLHMRYLDPIDYKQSAKLLIKVLWKKRECVSDVQLQMLGERGEQLKRGTKFNKIDQLHHDIIAELIPESIKLESFPQITVDATAIRSNEIGRKRKYLVHDSVGDKNYLSVEKIALEYYTNRCGYTDGIHCEGRLIKASFTLFFWDLIYDPEILVPGTFLSKYQEVPLDMMTTYFYTNRKAAIDKRLRDISSEWSDSNTIEFLKSSFDMHSHESGLCEPGVYIKDTEILDTLVNCIGRKVLAKIYERLVKNVGQYSSGMPDLFLWNIEEKKSKFVEVKGENDKLSIKQNLWLKYLESIGAHIEVCIVHSIGSKRKQKVKCAMSPVEKEKKEQASSVSSSSSSGTPKKNKRKPKLKSGATPEKKTRTSEGKKETN